MNAVEIEEAVSDLARQPFDPQEFAFSFLEAFGNKPTTIKRLREGNTNKSTIVGGVLQRNNIHIVVSENGKVEEALTLLRETPETRKSKAQFILATDGQDFQAENIISGETLVCKYQDFHEYFSFFLELAGISTVKQIRESAFDIKATGRLNKLYIELLQHNPEWATAERRPDMNHFLARLIFCFFAEDTGIFQGEGLFTLTVQQMSMSDASDTHEIISEMFRAMDTKLKDREKNNIKAWANKFPYVNGELFSGSTDVPKFTKIARSYLIHVGNLDWKKINPDIFGSMIQAVADDEERGMLGMHYTSVPNILKVLNPLFLDDLREHLEQAGDNARKLLNLRRRMARIRVFDPACGSGNFLVIAYKQIREIEYEINKRRGEKNLSSEIPLTNFRGIELRDFSSEIARLALIIAEYQCDVLYRGNQLALAEFLPLDAENWITKGNALRINWLSVCPPTGTGVKLHGDDLFSSPLDQAEIDFDNEGGETFICGNPPYAGSSKQNTNQKSDLKDLFDPHNIRFKNLDYISGWFWLASKFYEQTDGAYAFVTTNSICQGEQVNILWPHILSNNQEIGFAHTAFKWSNLAQNNAGVTCVIVGVRISSSADKFLYFEDSRKNVRHINPYLIDYRDVFIPRYSNSISNLPKMLKGNQPTDGGNLILSSEEKRELEEISPDSREFIRPLFGAKELIDGSKRYCLWIEDDKLQKARMIPQIKNRIKLVKQARLKSSAKSTQNKAGLSHRFIQIQGYGRLSLVMPEVSSEKREYLTGELLGANCISTNKLFTVYDPEIYLFSVCSSKLHKTWIETVCGKLEERISYSNVLGYNTFPLPKLTEKNKKDLTECAEEILIARERHFPATIADLYDPKKMPKDLKQAHERNDEVLERIYIGRRFRNDTERLEKLFELYTQMTNHLKKV
ncbi:MULTISPECIES: class I SAM-dependent DNA methyltransferase [Aequorivita]|uniref:site-specific DNA-methyltransferase (adenine-specific) n=1 Tax=Aequorivita iocasae TaxID=2803865 RepID=A0ABX7DVH2_9FLAO|nr:MULTISPECIES: class I SAM-dependent DNA methyltransferase [Aequorivita]QQX77787.1 class I SAM-dependent DNA methyltransferase [Aequorivita iocasae]UCA57287.1 lactate dehydrogenase [Aequorivita sp. F7]